MPAFVMASTCLRALRLGIRGRTVLGPGEALPQPGQTFQRPPDPAKTGLLCARRELQDVRSPPGRYIIGTPAPARRSTRLLMALVVASAGRSTSGWTSSRERLPC